MAAANVQMFILGNLTQGEAHGYQLLARARMWGVEDWAGFGAKSAGSSAICRFPGSGSSF
jgi:hypothetical protein